jgi:hypothetical protein
MNATTNPPCESHHNGECGCCGANCTETHEHYDCRKGNPCADCRRWAAEEIDMNARAKDYLDLWAKSYKGRKPSDWLTALDREFKVGSKEHRAIYERVQDLIRVGGVRPGKDEN